MIKSADLTPAFGRDYKSKQSVLDDLNAGKDFKNNSRDPETNRLCSIRDLADGYHQVRWKRLNEVSEILVKGGKAS